MIDIDKAVRDYYYTHHSDLDDRHYDNCIRDLTAIMEKVRQDALTDAWDAAQSANALLMSDEPYSENELGFLNGIARACDMIQVYRKQTP